MKNAHKLHESSGYCDNIVYNIEQEIRELKNNLDYIDESSVDCVLNAMTECYKLLRCMEGENPSIRSVFKDDFRYFSKLMSKL